MMVSVKDSTVFTYLDLPIYLDAVLLRRVDVLTCSFSVRSINHLEAGVKSKTQYVAYWISMLQVGDVYHNAEGQQRQQC